MSDTAIKERGDTEGANVDGKASLREVKMLSWHLNAKKEPVVVNLEKWSLPVFLVMTFTHIIVQSTGGKHKALGLNPILHLVLSGRAPCFYPAAMPSSQLTVKE